MKKKKSAQKETILEIIDGKNKALKFDIWI